MMKRTNIILLLLLSSITLCAKVSVFIELTDGDVKEYDTAEIDSLSMIEPVPTWVEDIEGHRYPVGPKGGRYWMFKNLYVSEYDTLSPLRDVRLATSKDSTYAPYCTIGDYGMLYNWSAAVGLRTEQEAISQKQYYNTMMQGICPNKFHLPSRNEIVMLSSSVGNSGSNALRSSDSWLYEYEELFQSGTSSSSGFMAYPDGYARGEEHKLPGMVTSFWSADALSASSAYCTLLTGAGSITLGSEAKQVGRSVRCIWDGQTDRDWLYVYKKDTVERYRTDKIVTVRMTDDESEGFMYDKDGNRYATKRYGKTNWMTENLKSVTNIAPYKTNNGRYARYYVRSSGCGGEETVYYSLAATMNISEADAGGIYDKLGGVTLNYQVQGVCPGGWRLPQNGDFEKIKPEIKSGGFVMPSQSSVYLTGEAFSPGAEGVFWVSDFKSGYGYYGAERQYYIDGIPHIDYVNGYDGWLEYVKTESVIPAMPCRCVRDLKEPLLHCAYTAIRAYRDYGIWENNYPMIYFEKDGDGLNSMRVKVRDNADAEYVETQGYYNTIEFK